MIRPERTTIGAVIEAAVPDLASPPDRLAEVRRRVVRGRALRVSLAAGGVAMACAAVLALPHAFAGQRSASVGPAAEASARATAPSTPAVCSADHEPLPLGMGPSRSGPLAPPGARRAVLCVYISPDSTQWKLESSPELTKPVDRLLSTLNAMMDDKQWQAKHPGGTACNAAGWLKDYQILLEYPDRPVRTVSFSFNCGAAVADGVVRYDGGSRRIDAAINMFGVKLPWER